MGRRRWVAMLAGTALLVACGTDVRGNAQDVLTVTSVVTPAPTLSSSPAPSVVETTAAESAAATLAAASGGSRTLPIPVPETTEIAAVPTVPEVAPGPVPFTVAFAGDVHFAGRVADRLAADPATVFGVAAPGLAAADLTMVNLETAITEADTAVNKSFTFKAPPSALTALQLAGVDVATMANNHGADYGATGLADSLAAISASGFPVIGIGANAAQAYAPYRTTLGGTPVAIFAASQVQDETLSNFTAGPESPGIASAWSDQLVAGVAASKAAGDLVIVYLHWGIEYESCPDADQRALADQLAAAGATAIVGAHAHVLQGAGWRPDGVYVAYGLSNYLWWRSLGGAEDDNGVLKLTFDQGRVTWAVFEASQLDETGVPVPAVGETKTEIDAQWEADRVCADLSATPAG